MLVNICTNEGDPLSILLKPPPIPQGDVTYHAPLIFFPTSERLQAYDQYIQVQQDWKATYQNRKEKLISNKT